MSESKQPTKAEALEAVRDAFERLDAIDGLYNWSSEEATVRRFIEQPGAEQLGNRLRPMDEAPRNGTKIIVKERGENGNWYRLCWWVKPYSIHSQSGAWMHFCDGDAVSHITEQRALGWVPEPKDA